MKLKYVVTYKDLRGGETKTFKFKKLDRGYSVIATTVLKHYDGSFYKEYTVTETVDSIDRVINFIECLNEIETKHGNYTEIRKDF